MSCAPTVLVQDRTRASRFIVRRGNHCTTEAVQWLAVCGVSLLVKLVKMSVIIVEGYVCLMCKEKCVGETDGSN